MAVHQVEGYQGCDDTGVANVVGDIVEDGCCCDWLLRCGHDAENVIDRERERVEDELELEDKSNLYQAREFKFLRISSLVESKGSLIRLSCSWPCNSFNSDKSGFKNLDRSVNFKSWILISGVSMATRRLVSLESILPDSVFLQLNSRTLTADSMIDSVVSSTLSLNFLILSWPSVSDKASCTWSLTTAYDSSLAITSSTSLVKSLINWRNSASVGPLLIQIDKSRACNIASHLHRRSIFIAQFDLIPLGVKRRDIRDVTGVKRHRSIMPNISNGETFLKPLQPLVKHTLGKLKQHLWTILNEQLGTDNTQKVRANHIHELFLKEPCPQMRRGKRSVIVRLDMFEQSQGFKLANEMSRDEST
ncbi:hypothetical protein WICPIJ_001792 [Wickerhamomyces pijperi]|uniref:Uncharacterized protein n=1 Tax=Wickerhamomyces pijperi TaxID=599730 RepID=A0A9P8QCX4_WICPI|nr:hypothetical protein WICPIJ_001792 [Wickerhamomyces pijperi]